MFVANAQTNLKDAKVSSENVEEKELSRPKEEITLAHIWKEYRFYAKSVGGLRSMNDGLHYTVLEDGNIVKYAYKTGEKVSRLVNAEDLKLEDKKIKIKAYEISDDENKLLLATEKESIYRRSWKARHFDYDITDKTITLFREGE